MLPMMVLTLAAVTRPFAVTADEQRLSPEEGVLVMRSVMTPQFNPPFRSAFGDLGDFAVIGALPKGVELVDAFTATYKGHRLTMTVSGDRKAFQVMLVPANGCGPSWFSSEKGVIYSGVPLGCQEPASPSS